MVSPCRHITLEFASTSQLQQIGIQSGSHLLAGNRLSFVTTRIVSEDLLDVQNPLVSCSDVGLNGAKVGANPVDDL